MTDETTADLHEAFEKAIENGDIDRAADIERRIREADEPVTDLLEQFTTAIEREEFERAKTLYRELKRAYGERRATENARAQRVANARDNGAITDPTTAEAYLRALQATTMDRLTFFTNALVVIEQTEATDTEAVLEQTRTLRSREQDVEAKQRDALSAIDARGLPASLGIVDVSTGGDIEVGESTTVTLTVYNSGGAPATAVEATVAPEGGLRTSDTRKTLGTVDADESTSVEFSLEADTAGEFAATFELTSENTEGSIERTTIEVTDSADGAERPIEEYTDDRGIVTTEGLQRAVSDWSRGAISTSVLQRVVAAWSSGDPV